MRRSTESATAPRKTAATPPRPIEKPIERPDAVPIRDGRYCCAITIVIPNVPITAIPTTASAIAPAAPPTRTKTSISGQIATLAASSTVRSPIRSAIGPAARVPIPPIRSIDQRSAVPYDFEWPSDTSQSGTNVSTPYQARLRKVITVSSSDERADVVLSGDPCSRLAVGHEAEQVAAQAEQDGRDEQARDSEEQRAVQPERVDEQRRRERAEAEAEVAADREERHPARPPAAADVRRELRALGMERGRPEPGDDHARDHEPVRRRDARQRHPDPARRDARRDQPDRAVSVRPEAEERLDDRPRDRRAEHQHRRERVREVELVVEVRDHHVQRAAREVHRAVTARERRHRPAVDPLPHPDASRIGSVARRMEIAVSKNAVQADTTAFAVLDPVESLADPRLEPLLAAGEVSGAAGATAVLHTDDGRVVAAGGGRRDQFDADSIRDAAAGVARLGFGGTPRLAPRLLAAAEHGRAGARGRRRARLRRLRPRRVEDDRHADEGRSSG